VAPIIHDAILAEGKRALAPRPRGALHLATEPATPAARIPDSPARAPEDIAHEMVSRIEADRAEALSRDRERALEEARREGHEQGAAAGYVEGMQQAREEIDTLTRTQRESFEALVASIGEARRCALESAAGDAVALAFAAACRILGEAFVSAEGVRAAIDHALGQAAAEDEVIVRVARADLDRLYESEPAGIDRGGLKLVADPSISMGGCVIETSAGSLDARLETQVSALRAALLDAHSVRGETGARE